MVLLQVGLLGVGVVTLWTAGKGGVFGPGLANAAPTEVVLTGQLDRLGEHMEANGANKFLFETVPPSLGHV